MDFALGFSWTVVRLLWLYYQTIGHTWPLKIVVMKARSVWEYGQYSQINLKKARSMQSKSVLYAHDHHHCYINVLQLSFTFNMMLIGERNLEDWVRTEWMAYIVYFALVWNINAILKVQILCLTFSIPLNFLLSFSHWQTCSISLYDFSVWLFLLLSHLLSMHSLSFLFQTYDLFF